MTFAKSNLFQAAVVAVISTCRAAQPLPTVYEKITVTDGCGGDIITFSSEKILAEDCKPADCSAGITVECVESQELPEGFVAITEGATFDCCYHRGDRCNILRAAPESDDFKCMWDGSILWNGTHIEGYDSNARNAQWNQTRVDHPREHCADINALSDAEPMFAESLCPYVKDSDLTAKMREMRYFDSCGNTSQPTKIEFELVPEAFCVPKQCEEDRPWEVACADENYNAGPPPIPEGYAGVITGDTGLLCRVGPLSLAAGKVVAVPSDKNTNTKCHDDGTVTFQGQQVGKDCVEGEIDGNSQWMQAYCDYTVGGAGIESSSVVSHVPAVSVALLPLLAAAMA